LKNLGEGEGFHMKLLVALSEEARGWSKRNWERGRRGGHRDLEDQRGIGHAGGPPKEASLVEKKSILGGDRGGVQGGGVRPALLFKWKKPSELKKENARKESVSSPVERKILRKKENS